VETNKGAHRGLEIIKKTVRRRCRRNKNIGKKQARVVQNMFWRQGQRNAAKAGRPAGRRVVVAEQKHARAHCFQGRAASCVVAAAATAAAHRCNDVDRPDDNDTPPAGQARFRSYVIDASAAATLLLIWYRSHTYIIMIYNNNNNNNNSMRSTCVPCVLSNGEKRRQLHIGIRIRSRLHIISFLYLFIIFMFFSSSTLQDTKRLSHIFHTNRLLSIIIFVYIYKLQSACAELHFRRR